MCPSKYGPSVQKIAQQGASSKKTMCDDFITAYCMNEFKTYLQKTREKEPGAGPESYNVSNWAKYSPICACYPNYILYLSNNGVDISPSSKGVPRRVWLQGCSKGLMDGMDPYLDPDSRSNTSPVNYTCNVNVGDLVALEDSTIQLGIASDCGNEMEKASKPKAKVPVESSKETTEAPKTSLVVDHKAVEKTASEKIATDKAIAEKTAAERAAAEKATSDKATADLNTALEKKKYQK